MSKLVRVVAVLILVALAGGGLFLATWEIPAPTSRHEIQIPDERFQN